MLPRSQWSCNSGRRLQAFAREILQVGYVSQPQPSSTTDYQTFHKPRIYIGLDPKKALTDFDILIGAHSTKYYTVSFAL